MSLDKIFGLYTVGFLGVTVLIGIGEALGLFSNRMIGWIFMATVAAHLRLHRDRDPHVECRPVLRGRAAACPPSTTAWPPAPTGCRPRPSFRWAAPCRRRGSRVSPTSWAGPADTCSWPCSSGPYLRQFGAYTIPDFLGARYGGNAARVVGVVGGHRVLVHVPDRPGHRGWPHRLPLHRPRLQHRRVRGAAGCAVLLGAGRDAVGHLDPGGAVHHPDHLVSGARRVPLVDDLQHPHPRADVRTAPPAQQRRRDRDHARSQGEGDAGALEDGGRRDRRQAEGGRPVRRGGRQAPGSAGHRHAAGHRPRGQRRREAQSLPDRARPGWACGISSP